MSLAAAYPSREGCTILLCFFQASRISDSLLPKSASSFNPKSLTWFENSSVDNLGVSTPTLGPALSSGAVRYFSRVHERQDERNNWGFDIRTGVFGVLDPVGGVLPQELKQRPRRQRVQGIFVILGQFVGVIEVEFKFGEAILLVELIWDYRSSALSFANNSNFVAWKIRCRSLADGSLQRGL